MNRLTVLCSNGPVHNHLADVQLSRATRLALSPSLQRAETPASYLVCVVSPSNQGEITYAVALEA